MPPKEPPRVVDPLSPGTTTRSAAAALLRANEEIELLREQLAASGLPRQLPPPRDGDLNDPRNAAAATASSFRLPPFYEHDARMWFGQCESVFRRRLCFDPVQRFDAIVEALPPHIAATAREIILEINPEEDPTAYNQLRDHLTGTFGRTKWQLATALLDAPMLGDRKPTAMLTEMRTLKPPGCQEDTVFQMIFIRCLPQSIGAQIMAADLENVDAMARMADRIVALPRQAPTAASIEDPGLVAAIPSRGRSPTRPAARGGRGGGGKGGKGRGKGGKGVRAQTPGGDKRGWCRNHLVWGEKAFKCIPPCTWFPEEN
jgi:hypothetical protein